MSARHCIPIGILSALALACRGDADRPRTARVDSMAADSMAPGPADPIETPFMQWWRGHARRFSLHLSEPQRDPPVHDLARFALAGADTTVVGAPEPIEILDLVRQQAKLPNTEGTYQVYTFPEWERQLSLWVPEDGEHCATQRAALSLGDGQPTFFELNPLCPSAGVQYDLDGVAITAYYLSPDRPPWLEFRYNTPPCSPIYLFRWAVDREAIELVRAVRNCNEARLE